MIAARIVMDMLTVGIFLRRAVSFFLRSGFHVTLALHTMYSLAWRKGWLRFCSKSRILEDLLFLAVIVHGCIPFFVGCLGVKLTHPPLPGGSVGRVAVWAGSVPPARHVCLAPVWVLAGADSSFSSLRSPGSLACYHFRQNSGERSCKSSTSLSCPVD